MRTHLRFLALLLPLFAIALPTSASAQWHGYPPPYPAYWAAGPESSLRVNVKPKEASVYVDGFYAGKVEEFNGKLQRLHVLPGEHEIVVYLEGFRSLTQRLYLSPNSTKTIEGTLEKLAPGEAQEPQPKPSERERMEPPDEDYPQPPPPRAPMGRRGPIDQQPPPRRGPRIEQSAEPSRFASLSIRVQPGGSVIRIDGERWDGPSDDDRLIVQVAEGHHTIEVERDGYERFTTEIDVRRGETTPVNVSLRRQ